MYVYIKFALPDFLMLFINPVADIAGIWDGIISMLSFKRRMSIIPGILITAGQDGII